MVIDYIHMPILIILLNIWLLIIFLIILRQNTLFDIHALISIHPSFNQQDP